MNLSWFSLNMMWASILLYIMPSYIQSVVGEDAKGGLLGLVLGTGAFVSALSAPVFGAFSDRMRVPGGRRKPWIVIGTFGIVAGLLALSYWTRPGDRGSLPGWIIVFMFLELVSAITGPYSALIADQVSIKQRGSFSGWLGLMSMLGYLVGGFTGLLVVPLGVSAVYNILIVVVLLGLLATIFGVEDSGISPETPRFSIREFLSGLYTPFKYPDFSWVFFNRLLVALGISTLQEFVLYYMADGFGSTYVLAGFGKVADTADGAVAFFLPVVFLGAIATTLVAGVLSDRFGRKPIAYAACLGMAVACIVLIFSHSFTLSLLVGIVYGMGQGAYESVSRALVTDVLPSANDHAKDINIWHIAIVLSQIIAAPIAGFLLDHFQATGMARNIPHMGYTVIFVVAVMYFILGSMCLKQIKTIR